MVLYMGAVRSKYKRCPRRKFKIMGKEISNFHIRNTRRKTHCYSHHTESRLGQNVHMTNLDQCSFVSEVSNLVASQCSLYKWKTNFKSSYIFRQKSTHNIFILVTSSRSLKLAWSTCRNFDSIKCNQSQLRLGLKAGYLSPSILRI